MCCEWRAAGRSSGGSMSEKIYRLLLRLYPREFQKSFGEVALQLFRELDAEERGVFAKVRLWMAMLGDLANSVPEQHLRAAGAGLTPVHIDGLPSFRSIEEPPPSVGALLMGAMLTMALIGVGGALNQPGSPVRAGWISLVGSSTPTGDHVKTDVKTRRERATESGGSFRTIDAEGRRTVLEAVEKHLKQYYVDREVGAKVADALEAKRKAREYDVGNDGAFLAFLLTRDMRALSGDRNLEVIFHNVAIPDRPTGPTRENFERYQAAMARNNCTFEKVEMLPRKIGYVKLNSFPQVSVCGSAAAAAMGIVNDASAVIFDLRDNRGGFGEMVSMIAAYLFDHPEYLYNPRESVTARSWTRSPMAGSRLADKPVYVLTSSITMSAAEQFTYDLKMLKRATIVGEKTRGAAHAGVYHRLDDHFGMAIPEVRPVNPFGDRDWEGSGVFPDVQVPAAEALDRAVQLARGRRR
jgi:hypothetical protein